VEIHERVDPNLENGRWGRGWVGRCEGKDEKDGKDGFHGLSLSGIQTP
jgi:hypothetical protein